jgi:hypothetical protein
MKPKVYGFIPEENLIDLDFSCRLVVDPNKEYFNLVKKERESFDKMILIHGCEPKSINNITKEIIENSQFFDKIYSFDEEVLINCKNSEIFQFGSCWTLTDKIGESIMKESEFVEKNFNKEFKVSFIKSNKNLLEGHKIRNSVPELLKNKSFKILHMQNIPIKFPLFKDSMFHVSIENTREKNYFTEKIIDCFMTKTIPIYWGCPNITDIFDKNGILVFNDLSELDYILKNLTKEDYLKKIESVEKNYIISKKYAFFYERINNILLKLK